MNRRQLAADLADLVAEAEATVKSTIWAQLRPLIVNAWGMALRPALLTPSVNSVTAAAVDDTALRAISSTWQPPEELGGLLVDLYDQGNLHATTGFFGEDVPGEVLAQLSGPVYDQAAQAYLAEATNRLSGIGDAAWSEARAAIHELMGTGFGREETKQALQRVLAVSEFRADTIARTELGGAANAGVQHAGDTLAAAGFAVAKEWFAQHDPRTRPTHVAADGQRVPLDGFFTVGGYEMSRPHDPMGPAEEVVNCRCTMLMVEAAAVEPVVEAADVLAEASRFLERDSWEALPSEQRDGIAAYRGSGYKPINRTLRGQELSATLRERWSDEEVARLTAGLDDAFRFHGTRLSQPLTVSRQIDARAAASFTPGAAVVDPGYVSTTTFAQMPGSGLMTASIRLPAGTNVLGMSEIEGELLLPRGTTFRVVERRENTMVLEVEAGG